MIRSLIDDESLDLICAQVDFSSFSGKKILITGGTGMVGSYLAEAIIRGTKLHGIAFTEMKITGKSISSELMSKFSKFSNVIISADSLSDSLTIGNYQVIFHLASPASPTQYTDLESLLQINSDCLVNLIGSFTEKFVFVSTGEVYGNKGGILSEQDSGVFGRESPRDWYPYAKLSGERKSNELCIKHGSELYIVRLFHTFGPGVRRNDGRSFADFLYSSANGVPPRLYSDGLSLRTFLFSADAIVGILTIATKGRNFNIYNVGSNVPISILDFAKRVSELAGLGGRLHMDTQSNSGYLQSPNKVLIPNLDRIFELGWKIRVPLDSSIEKTLAYINSES